MRKQKLRMSSKVAIFFSILVIAFYIIGPFILPNDSIMGVDIIPKIETAIMTCTSILFVIRLWMGKAGDIPEGARVVLGFAFALFSGSVVSFIGLTACGILFVARRFMIAVEDQEYETNEELRRKREAELAEKQRLKLPGKYSPLLYKVVFKNFKANSKNYILLLTSASVSMTLMFAAFALQRMLSKTHSEEAIGFLGGGISGILMTAVMVIGVVTVFLMGFVLAFYSKSRMRDYSMLLILGSRKNALYLLIVSEYVGSLLISIIVGLISGNILTALLKVLIRHYYGAGAKFAGIDYRVYLYSMVAYVLIYLVTAVVSLELFFRADLSGAMNAMKSKERIPHRGLKVITLIGLLFSGYAVWMYHLRAWAEGTVFLVVFLLGLYLLFRYGGAFILRRLQKKSSYFRKVLERNPFYYRFRSNINKLYIFTVLHFLVLVTFAVQLITPMIAQKPETLFPYDFVCMADEADASFFEGLNQEYNIKMQSYPMLRVTTTDGDEDLDDIMGFRDRESGIWSQGQHIGISEDTYDKLNASLGNKQNKLHLKGREIHIVFQQDKSVKAHPLDWYLLRETPYLRIGQPVTDYDLFARELIFRPQYTVVGEEINPLIGTFVQGMQEDLVVFSNDYFRELQTKGDGSQKDLERFILGRTGEGPKQLVLLSTEAGDRKEIAAKLDGFKKNHKDDEAYDSAIKAVYDNEQSINDIRSERMMSMMVSGFIIVLLLLCGLFILYIHNVSDMDALKREYEFLVCMGMYEKDRGKLITKRMILSMVIPPIAAIVSAIIFTGLTFYVRYYTMTDIWRYMRYWTVLCIAYFAVYFLGFLCVRQSVRNHMKSKQKQEI